MCISVVDSDVPSSSQTVIQMSESSSAVFNEGYLATTLDRKDKKHQEETSFQNSMLLHVTASICIHISIPLCG